MQFSVSQFSGPGYRIGTITITAPGALNGTQTIQVIQGSDPYSEKDIQMGNLYLSASPGGPPIPSAQVGQSVYLNFSDNFVGYNPGGSQY